MSGANKAKLGSCTLGEVDHPALDEGTAIIDAHNNGLAVLLIGNSDLRAKGKAAMGRCHG